MRVAARPPVARETRGGVAWLTLDRPATQNRLDAALMTALVERCEEAEHDDAVRVVVLGAAGRSFSAGLPAGTTWPPAAWADGVGAVGRLTKPVIACLTGEVRGWGVALALACDLRVAATGTLLRLDAGRLVGGGATQRLTRSVGPARALAMLLLADPVPARTAAEWGLVTRVVPRGRLRAAASAMARDLAARGPLALRFAKEAVTRALDLPLDEGLRLEHDLYVLLQTTADRAEGVASFLERRPPRFVGR